jgi:carbon monoxide dehydrogenase subunit G
MLRRVPRVTGVPSSAYVIEYDGTFTFPVPIAQLWARLVQVDRFSSWWSWLREFAVEGNGLEHGTVLHGIVAPPLPYRMRVDVVLDECVPERRITAFVHGDLEGAAQLTFDGDDAETRAHATWTVEMMQRPMRVAARIAHPLLRWGHDRVVDATVDGFRRHLVGENAR